MMGFDKDYIDQFREMTPEEIENHIGLEKVRNVMVALPVEHGIEKIRRLIKAIKAETSKAKKKIYHNFNNKFIIKILFCFLTMPLCPLLPLEVFYWNNLLWNSLWNLLWSLWMNLLWNLLWNVLWNLWMNIFWG